MERKIIQTADGSVTIHLPEWDEQYHSKHGAVQEALHVFINSGLYFWIEKEQKKEVSILEIGFGTGLNAFITYLEAKKADLKIKYTGVEAFPVTSEEVKELNYAEKLRNGQEKEIFLRLHEAEWDKPVGINGNFVLTKLQKKFHQIQGEGTFNLIYYDAFGARVQPELWTEEIFAIMHRALEPGGVLVTYSAKGSVRRALQKVGFMVERLPGPPGKREMLRALKNKTGPC